MNGMLRVYSLCPLPSALCPLPSALPHPTRLPVIFLRRKLPCSPAPLLSCSPAPLLSCSPAPLLPRHSAPSSKKAYFFSYGTFIGICIAVGFLVPISKYVLPSLPMLKKNKLACWPVHGILTGGRFSTVDLLNRVACIF